MVSSIGLQRNPAVPALRGVFHFWAIWFAAAGALALFLMASSARAAVAIYGLGLVALFTGSATYHRWRWDERWRPLLRRVDHATIFVFIAATYTPVGVLVVRSPALLAVVWAGAALGVAFSLCWIDAPRWLQALLYIGLGWVGVTATPSLLHAFGAAPVTLFAAGGILYSAGAVVYARQRPNPWPLTFGFHEIFHAFVIGAAVCHFVAMAGWVVG